MTPAFLPLDWIWTLLFIALMVVCGVIFYKLGKRSEADFFLAGRGLPWWLPATSVYATHTATDTPMWIGGTIYHWGMRGIWYPFFSAWCAISPFFSTRIFRRSLAMSQAECHVGCIDGVPLCRGHDVIEGVGIDVRCRCCVDRDVHGGRVRSTVAVIDRIRE